MRADFIRLQKVEIYKLPFLQTNKTAQFKVYLPLIYFYTNYLLTELRKNTKLTENNKQMENTEIGELYVLKIRM